MWQNEALLATQSLAARERELGAQLLASHAEAARISQTLANRESAFGDQLRESRQQTQAISQRLVAREQELSQQLDRTCEETARHAAQEHELNERLSEKEQVATLTRQQHVAQVQKLEERIHTGQVRANELDLEIQERKVDLLNLERTSTNLELEFNEQLRIGRESNYRLQQALRTVQGELTVARKTLSWRLTAPFRIVGDLFQARRLQSEVPLVPTLTPPTPDILDIQKLTVDNATSETTAMPDDHAVCAIETVSINAALDVTELLQRHGQSFIECAYLTLLHRYSDPTGRDYYLGRLRAGAQKIQILREISESPEALSKAVVVPGLRDAIRKYKLAHLPLIGDFLKVLLNIGGDSAFEVRQRAVEQEIFLFEKQSESRFGHIDRGLSNLQTLIVEQGQQPLAPIQQSIREGGRVGEASESGTAIIKPSVPAERATETAVEKRIAAVDDNDSTASDNMKLGTIPSEDRDTLSAILKEVSKWPLGRRAIE
jgi:hypothetical protein